LDGFIVAILIPRIVVAGQRESGTLCARCNHEVEIGEVTSICRACGAVHHSPCWDLGEGCSAYECSTTAARRDNGLGAKLTITREELASAEPLPTRAESASDQSASGKANEPKKRWNRTAVAAFILALLGIPLFGLVTGLFAMVVGCMALVGHSSMRRGMALAVVAIVIGLFEVVGWAAGLFYMLGTPHSMVALNQLTIDPESLDELPERIARAMRANVIVETGIGFGQGLGSGVILKLSDGMAHIVTNRHVVDPSYSEQVQTVPKDLSTLRNISVTTVGEKSIPAIVEWLAPHGVDLAIISAPLLSNKAEEAHWDQKITPHIGDSVFAVGNPHGLGWTHSAGDISQIRRQMHGDYNIRMVQTTAAINPGNSGGGLYDSDGRLIGINTMTGDKRVAEGLGFSIALQTLMDLIPDQLHLPHQNPEARTK
jgi:hypothetical protein